MALCDIALWEISLLGFQDRITLPAPTPAFVKYPEKSFEVLPITGAVAERSMLFSEAFPKDPADRVIGATPLVHGLKLITSDGLIHQTGEVPCLW